MSNRWPRGSVIPRRDSSTVPHMRSPRSTPLRAVLSGSFFGFFLVSCAGGEPITSSFSPDAGSALRTDERVGCNGSVLLQVPADTAERGPWAVGVRTVSVALPFGRAGG